LAGLKFLGTRGVEPLGQGHRSAFISFGDQPEIDYSLFNVGHLGSVPLQSPLCRFDTAWGDMTILDSRVKPENDKKVHTSLTLY